MVPRKIVVSGLVVLGLACGERGRQVAERRDDPATSRPAAAAPGPGAIVFLGTSLTAGLGVPREQAFPALIQDTLEALGIEAQAVNAGVSGETSAGGLRRIDWLLRRPVSVLVLELGANDALRGLDVEALRSNLQAIIDSTRSAYPEVAVVILGMQAPPNLGRDYTTAFQRVYPDLAAANDAALVPFLLDSVAGIPALNQADGIHPTAEGHRIMARTVWRVLEDVVRRRQETTTAR